MSSVSIVPSFNPFKIANLTPKKGWYDVVIHGTKDGLGFTANGNRLSPYELYGKMLADGYQQGTRIRLLSCYSGSLSNGAAQQLSRLANAGVMAPRSWLSVSNGIGFMPRGSFFVRNGKGSGFFRP